MSEGALTTGQPVTRQPLLRLLSDERLVKLASEGSTQAFAAIYERHHQAVYRYCRSILRSDHDARDALQSTMLKAMQALGGESREIALRPWLFRIAHNESISVLRGRPADAPIDGASELAAVDVNPEARERLRALIADLDQLSLRQRSALVMRELNGLEFEEIGVALETSPEAAKQAVYEARLALHELEEGREMTCDEVRRKISAEDRRLLRGRRVRGHLRSCESCGAFERSTRARRAQLACIAPPLPAPIALGILQSLIGGGTGGGGIAALAGGGAAAGLGGSTLAKLGVAGVLAVGIGTAALESGEPGTAASASPGGAAARPDAKKQIHSQDRDRARDSRDEAAEAPEGQGREDADRRGAGGDGSGDGGERGGQGGLHGSIAPGESSSHGEANGGSHTGPSGNAQTVPDEVELPESDGAEESGGGEESQGSTDDGEDGPTGSDDDSAHGGGPAGTPPGHGGVPPGHGGVPPGLGAPPPGHDGPAPGGGDEEDEED